MIPRRFACLLSVPAFLLTFVSTAPAQAPDRLDHFRIIPRFSVLHESGGFAGIEQRYRLLGEYDLHRAFNGHSFPPEDPLFTANFVNAEIWGSIDSPLPAPAVATDVDEILSLEELEGERIFVDDSFDAYRFTGRTGDGSSVDLLGVLLGPWMFVAGETAPPVAGADFFEYDVRWLARSRPWADLNDDGVVGAADYTALRNSMGSDSAADLTSDGAVDAHDLQELQAQFGEREPDIATFEAMVNAAAAALGSQSLAIPEPSSFFLFVAGLMALAFERRSRGVRFI